MENRVFLLQTFWKSMPDFLVKYAFCEDPSYFEEGEILSYPTGLEISGMFFTLTKSAKI